MSAGVILSPIRERMVRCPGYLDDRVDLHSSESILIYLTVAGSVIPIRVLESDSIASVKLRIQTCKGFVVKKQKLVFGGRELARNDSLVKDYGITGGNVLHLVLKLADLLAVIVRTACGKEFEVQVDRFRNVGYIKQKIFKEGKGFVDHLDNQELFFKGEKLDDERLISDVCKNNDAVIHLIVKKSAKVRTKPVDRDVELSVVASNLSEKSRDVETAETKEQEPQQDHQVVGRKPADFTRDSWLSPIIVNPKAGLPSSIWDMIDSTFDGLVKGNQPVRSTEGTGGAYLMRDSMGNKFVSVFKPIDEEPMAINNPQGLPLSSNGEGLKKGTRVGEGALREVAAYLLDHPKNGPRLLSGEIMGFSGVPLTAMVQCLHKGFNHPEGFEYGPESVKIGSLQMFVENEGSCEDVGPQAFPVEEVHKISVLDIRMANADRHAGNILVHKDKNGRTKLIPIDHGYCLPENFEDCTFDWLYWPQAKQPYSRETLDFINSLDAEHDIALLKFHGWDVPIECARILNISTMLLKKGAERGLSPYTIGSIMCRETLHDESVIEEILVKAQNSLLPSRNEAALLETVSELLDLHLDKLTTK